MGWEGGIPIISFIGTFRPTGIIFGVLCQSSPQNLLLSSPFTQLSPISCAFVEMREIAWSSLEQGKKLQHFLEDRVEKFTSLCLEQGQGFSESAEPPYPNSC